MAIEPMSGPGPCGLARGSTTGAGSRSRWRRDRSNVRSASTRFGLARERDQPIFMLPEREAWVRISFTLGPAREPREPRRPRRSSRRTAKARTRRASSSPPTRSCSAATFRMPPLRSTAPTGSRRTTKRSPDSARASCKIFTVVEHGLTFRYVPAGVFIIGSRLGEPDERPVHPVRLSAFWIADVPVTWSVYCAGMGWTAPPAGAPLTTPLTWMRAHDHECETTIRAQYCARSAGGRYDEKPLVAVTHDAAQAFAERLTTEAIAFSLPTEAQWEKATRGGLVGQRWPWGGAPPTRSRCDFGRLESRLREPRLLPPNGYGLHGMSGGVWEWTRTRYDALGARRRAELPGLPCDPTLEPDASAESPVVRGG